MKKQAKIETAAHSKKVVTAMRKQMLSDSGAVLTHGVERDEHGDTVAFCDYRATCKARMIAADYALILAVDGARGCLDGLRVGTFEGLAIGPDHGAGDVYAVFTNGRKVPFLREERTPVTDPNERTARIAEYTLLQKENAADVTENKSMLTIPEAADYAGVSTRTIRNWIKTETGTGPMLRGVIGTGRMTRIPAKSLDPYRKTPPQIIAVKRKK
jgi:hypothetical protein